MANLPLEIGNLVQIGVLIWSISVNPTQSYTRLSLYVCACAKCTLKLCMVMYNYALSSWARNKRFDLKYFIVKKILLDTPKRRKYFTTNNFHMKISDGESFPNYGICISLVRDTSDLYPCFFLLSMVVHTVLVRLLHKNIVLYTTKNIW